MNLKPYWDYFKYILEHKKNVFKICWKYKQYIHAFTHDLSKFSMKEFGAYAEWFYGHCGKNLEKKYNQEQLTNGLSCLSRSYLECKQKFDKAWEHHYKHNPHHWEYWLDKDEVPQSMPNKYLQQMISDWQGMALKFGDTAQQYYLNNYKKIKLDYCTRVLLEYALDLNESVAHNYGHTLEDFVNMYDEETYNSYDGNYIKNTYGIDSWSLLRN